MPIRSRITELLKGIVWFINARAQHINITQEFNSVNDMIVDSFRLGKLLLDV